MASDRRKAQLHSNGVLHLAWLRKPTGLLVREHRIAVDPHVEHAAAARHERHTADVGFERSEQLLRQPGGSSAKVADCAVLDRHDGLRLHIASIIDAPHDAVNVARLDLSC